MEETTKIRGDDKEDDEHEGRHVFFEGGHDFRMFIENDKSIVFDRGANLTILRHTQLALGFRRPPRGRPDVPSREVTPDRPRHIGRPHAQRGLATFR